MGSPFYELSLLFMKDKDPFQYLKQILDGLKAIHTFKIVDRRKDEKIREFIIGWDDGDNSWHRSIDLDCEIQVAGSRQCRLFITELSGSSILCDLWFFGSKESSPDYLKNGIHDKEKPAFRLLLKELILQFNPKAATIGYEVDCQELFGSINPYPHIDYEIENIMDINEMIHVLTGMAFEYCWVNRYQFEGESVSQTVIDRTI